MLRRIPAVKWAFSRLRPLPHSGSIDDAVRTADDSCAIVADTTEAAPALDSSISAHPSHCDADITAPVGEDDTAISVIAESPSAAPTDIDVSDDASRQTSTEVEPVDAAELIGNDPAAELATSVDLVIAEEAPVWSVDVASAAVDAPVLIVNDDPSSDVVVDPANDAAPVAVIAADDSSAGTPSVITNVAPEPILVSPAPVITSAPKTRAKVMEPVDRATLIRQRWAETGIRMWNPRLHGTGDATLNIQGRVELLPPASGETMPRYDKLEFRMLGGQIVCEGVIVEAPAPAGHRSFTRLAEARNPDRTREPVRERQAALA
ncbi:hypothetical protein IVA80_18680 [Bradyrhizobium sp. 139]|nr:hypothetical protein [Bradyrhizobium sp. 139]MCK1742847.1 hypothetical protein [Bradyrhizobium sp. 139]